MSAFSVTLHLNEMNLFKLLHLIAAWSAMKPQGNLQLNLPSQNQTRVTRERGGGGCVGVGEMEAEVAWSG